MESRLPKLAAIFVVLSLMTGAVFTVHYLGTRQILNKKLVLREHPYIVLKVDNRGCQAEIETRTRVVVAPR